MPQNVQSKPGEDAATLEAARGLVVDAADPKVLRRAVDLAFDYRGDVTLHLAGQPEPLVGYVYDRRTADSLDESVARVIPADGSSRRSITYADITRLEFTGRDTAAGKSFETWMRKYVAKKLAGEDASIHGTTHENPGDSD